jgi:hypothetical protein
MKRRPWLRAVLIVAVITGVFYLHLWRLHPLKRLGFVERDYARIARDMTQQEVLDILDRPSEIAHRQPGAPNALAIAELNAPGARPVEAQWYWHRGLQTIRVVFDDRGRVVYKDVDY